MTQFGMAGAYKAVLIMLLLAVSGPAAAAGATAIARLPESDREFDSAFVERHRMERVRLQMAAGEGEPALIVVEPDAADGKFSLSVSSSDAGPAISTAAYQLGWVSVATRFGGSLRKLDPMIPLALGVEHRCQQALCPLWLRFSAAADAEPGSKHEISVELRVTGQPAKTIAIDAEILPLRIDAEPQSLRIQAALARVVGEFSEDKVLDAYRLLARFKINTAAVNPRLVSCIECFYPKLLDLPGVSAARLMFQSAALFFRQHGRSRQQVDAFIEQLDNQLLQHQDLVERFPGKLHVKLWDEPEPEDLPLAKRIYAHLSAREPALKAEVAGVRERSQVNAGVDVVRLQDIDVNMGAEGRLWLYANTMHSLRRPYHTMRNIGWLLWLLDASGYHFWDVANSRGQPLQRVLGAKDRLGRGLFLYPDLDNGVFLPSLRLAMFREGIEDYQLLRALGRDRSQPLRQRALRAFKLRSGRKMYLNDPAELRAALAVTVRQR